MLRRILATATAIALLTTLAGFGWHLTNEAFIWHGLLYTTATALGLTLGASAALLAHTWCFGLERHKQAKLRAAERPSLRHVARNVGGLLFLWAMFGIYDVVGGYAAGQDSPNPNPPFPYIKEYWVCTGIVGVGIILGAMLAHVMPRRRLKRKDLNLSSRTSRG